MRIVLAQPRGFCAGVVRAVEIVEKALGQFGAPVYVRHEIVHNRRVVEALEAQGAVFVEELDAVPAGAVTVFSAHGVAPAVEAEAARRGLPVIDATCPLVSKVHQEGRRYAQQGRPVVLIGHAGHAEVAGTIGQIAGEVHLVASVAEVEALPIPPERPIAYVTQTTLSVDDTRAIIAALHRRYPDMIGPDTRDICYATQNRQTAVRELAKRVDLLLVVRAANSSNSSRLREIGAEQGVPCHLIPDAEAVQRTWLQGVGTLGITAGASAPESLVQEVIARIRQWVPVEVATLPGIVEDVQFKLPAPLIETRARAAS